MHNFWNVTMVPPSAKMTGSIKALSSMPVYRENQSGPGVTRAHSLNSPVGRLLGYGFTL